MMTPESVHALAVQGLAWARQVADRPQLGFDAEAVAWIDDFVRQQRLLGIEQAKVTEYTVCLGSILGECVMAGYGGKWQRYGTEWMVDFGAGHHQRPYFAVLQQFEAPAAPRVLDWYHAIATAPGARRKSWWRVWG